MKYSARDYAVALYESLEKTKSVSEMLGNFLNIVEKNHDQHLMKEIVKHFEDYYKDQKNILEIHVQSARKLSAWAKKLISKKVKSHAIGYEHFEVIDTVRPECMGGVKFSYLDKMYDATIETKLDKMKKHLKSE
ncbi:MAG: F0F1 ATP synthase subunit delta [Parcubacteria group bacterium]|nr:F0F1 ATP synthase subunit delta [Parcubacteria group bacterium]